MGLLSDPEYGSLKWVRILKKFHTFISFVCYLAGISWLFLMAQKEFNNETYFSENALLPGLATNEFNAEHAANQFHNEFLQELKDKYDNTDEMPVPWLVAKMSQLHLEVYTHSFNLSYPLGQNFIGTNVYGILRAPRTASLEALVISVPYRPLSSHLKGTTAGVALMLAFAQFARPQKYWAKDIIFLVTEYEQLGMQAWLEAYHGLQSEPAHFSTSLGSFWKAGMPELSPSALWRSAGRGAEARSKCLRAGRLQGRSGAIQAAINLELHSPNIKYIEVKVEGLNGQLPNLDLVNLVMKLCMKAGIHHSFKSSYSWMRNRQKADDWSTSLYTMLEMANAQLFGVPTGNHGLFHRFGIEAVTLEGRDAADSPAAPRVSSLSAASFYRLGSALESVMRSCNNLLESFHQSYFFYLLPATNRFISIGQYMPSLCFMCFALLVRALGFWVTIQKEFGDDSEILQEEKKTEKVTETKSEVPGDQELKESGMKGREDKGRMESELSFRIVKIGTNILILHIIGYIAMVSPFYFGQFGGHYLGLPTERSVFYGLVLISVVGAPLSLALRRGLRGAERVLGGMLALLQLATCLLAVGVHNYALGTLLAALCTPPALAASPLRSPRILRIMQVVLCALMQPLLLLSICLLVYAYNMFPDETLGAILHRTLDAVSQAVMFGVMDSLIYGNWVFNVATLGLFPAWLMLWQVACAPPAAADTDDEAVATI